MKSTKTPEPKQKTFLDIESDLDEKTYTLELSHRAIRSLKEWLPKNYDSDDETKGEIEEALDTAVPK